VLNVVHGFGKEAGEALATSKRIAKIAFTGSTPVGSHILKCAAENIIPSTVELGGKSPNIYFEDIMQAEPSFIEKAAEGLVLGSSTRARCARARRARWCRNPSTTASWMP
jgi:aldehyde dehydrogenase